MKITKFKKTSKDKYKIFLENGETLTLYEDVILNNRLILTKELDEELKDKILEENDDRHVYGMAINYLSIRIRSIKEMEEYLYKKGISKSLIDKTIDKLIRNGYLNDFTFAKSYINDQLILTNNGPYKIKNNLIKLGINDDIINEAMEDIDNNIVKEKLSNLMEKQIRIKKGSSSALKIKLLNYFYNLGYDKEDIIYELNNSNIKTDLDKLKKEYDKLYSRYKNKYEGYELETFIERKLIQKGYKKDEIKKINTD